MRTAAGLTLALALLCGGVPLPLAAQSAVRSKPADGKALASVQQHVRARMQADVAALRAYRPEFPFWRHIFTVPDGSIIFGSAVDGRLLATFPANGDWQRDGVWEDPALGSVLDGIVLSEDLAERRDEVARLLTPIVGRVVHNATRGRFLQPNERRYGALLDEWGAIYERFGVPAEIGLSQALVESGLDGSIRSEVRAIGFCQWMPSNWNQLKRLSPVVIEGYNQTTQAPYCAAYLSILATKYGSFIPALSEHHAGGTNIGRALINGEWLGGASTRDRYFLGSDFVRDLRIMSPGTYRDIYGSYGPRSIRYAEMVFGNVANVERIRDEVPQRKIYAMRVPRSQTLAAIASRAKLTTDEVRRYNPALSRRVPANATLYLPKYIAAFGRDVSFWHRTPSRAYLDLLEQFVRLDVSPDEWDSPAFDKVLERFRTRFAATRTEEGMVMATTLAYEQRQRTSGQAAILADFRSSDEVRTLFDEARRNRDAFIDGGAAAIAADDGDAALQDAIGLSTTSKQ
ncbi:MAG TPA: hypothetical protein VFV95_06580 [Vicinamibacterales bacterium]|nr:hypothetical protein [Vicinamibacterales bacterium]